MPTLMVPDRATWNLIGVDAGYPLSGAYLQTANIDATAGINVIGAGTGAGRFSGTYDGGGFSITNIAINNAATDYQAPFGSSVGTITNLQTAGSVTGQDYVSGICGRNYGTVQYCKSTCTVSGRNFAGGNVGYNSGTLQYSYATGNVTVSAGYAGGNVGTNAGTVINCYATGNATAVNYAGGAIGTNAASSIYTGCYATGNVSGANSSRLCGHDQSTSISTGAHLTTTQLTQYESFLLFDWDFTTIWQMGVVIPNLVGLDLDSAGAVLNAVGCMILSVTYTYHATVPEGQIISQSVAAGSGTATTPSLILHGAAVSPKVGDLINVTVSLGNQVLVPSVLAYPQSAAEDYLEEYFFTVAVITASDEFMPAGFVVSQSPEGGTEATYQSEVTILVSTGHADVLVPDVVGDDIDTAVSTIETAGLLCDVTVAFDDHIALGNIISQNPDAGEEITFGSEVEVVVSIGIQTVEVPDVVGKTLADATTDIEAVTLVPVVSYAFLIQ
jgi:Uncharacterized protein conserved in bacteria